MAKKPGLLVKQIAQNPTSGKGTNQHSKHFHRSNPISGARHYRTTQCHQPDRVIYVALVLIAVGIIVLGNRLIYHNPFLRIQHPLQPAKLSVVGLNSNLRAISP